MALFGRDRRAAEHQRAPTPAAARLAEPLRSGDAEWLATHLAWCAPCGAVADEYDRQRVELRTLRLESPTPPRDLWARTAASLDAVAGTSAARRGAAARPSGG